MATYNGTSGNDTHSGGAGNDSISGNAGADSLSGGAGNDTIFGGSGNDTLYGDAGNDSINGDAGNDLIYGGAGNDTLNGDAGADTIYGGTGSDWISFADDHGQATVFGGEDAGNTETDWLGLDNWSKPQGATVTYTGSESGQAVFGATGATVVFSEIEAVRGTGVADVFDASAATGGVRASGAGGGDSMTGGSGGDDLSGDDGNDTIKGGGGSDTLYGGAGSDVISGEDGADLIFGGSGDDSVYGGAGNDTVYGGEGADYVELGDGDDRFGDWATDGGNDTVYGGAGNDAINGGFGDDILYGGDGDDSLIGGAGHDTLYGGAGSDWFSVTDDHDATTIFGGEDVGDKDWDTVTLVDFVSTQGATITYSDGETGHVQFNGTAATADFAEIERVEGTDHADTFDGSAATTGIDASGLGGDDTMTGGSGNDYLSGDGGDDHMFGGGGADFILGGDGNDLIYGGAGKDTLFGEAGDDTLYGGDGNDLLYGGADNDVLYGGQGDDRFCVTDHHGAITIFGGEDVGGGDWDGLSLTDYVSTQGVTVTYSDNETGHVGFNGTDATVDFAEIEEVEGTNRADTFDGTAATTGIWAYGLDGDDTMTGGSGDDFLAGDAGEDHLFGGAGADSLYGGDGNDTIYGGAGNDVLFGGVGNDRLILDGGNDTVTTGSGSDIIEIHDDNGTATITDFDMTPDIDGRTTDQFDVSDLRDVAGGPVNFWDVTATAIDSNTTLLTFPGGEQLIMAGHPLSSFVPGNQMAKMGIPCFATGTLIRTPHGEGRIETLRQGDLVLTPDGPMPILWCGGRTIDRPTLDAHPELRPVLIRKLALGNHSDLLVSPQHGMLMHHRGAEVLVRARHLAQAATGAARICKGRRSIGYHHILLARHGLVWANGALCETLYPGRMTMLALGPMAQVGLALQVPALRPIFNGQGDVAQIYGPTVRRFLAKETVVFAKAPNLATAA